MGRKQSDYDPLKLSDSDWEKQVNSGKIADFKRTDSGGVQVFKNMSDGGTKVSDIEPDDCSKGHRTTDFIIRDGFISEIRRHK